MFNILLLGAGRRVTFATQFQKHNCKIFNYDLNKQVPISDVATVIEGKKWDDPNLLEDLQKVIDENKIDLVLSLDCKGVETLSKIVDQLDTNVVCPKPKAAEICLDKGKLEKFMVKNFSDWYPSPIENEPCVVKPKTGYGSLGIEYHSLYSKSLMNNPDMISQLKLTGQEFSVDAYFNKQGKMVGASPRTRLWVSGGEVLESETVHNLELINMTKAIGEKLKYTGPSCFQYIKDKAENPKLIEINGRFGGGSTLGIEAGLDMIQMIIEEYLYGIKLEEDSVTAEHGVYVNRSFRDHYFRNYIEK